METLEQNHKEDITLNNFIFTFGYGNRKNYNEFFNYLEEFNITCVIDVRVKPQAWSRLWYKEQLENACTSRNVKYFSEVSLGNTSGNNEWIPPDTEKAHKTLRRLSKIAKEGTILFLCAELDSSRCHRLAVAQELQKLIDIPVKHLK